MALWLARKTGQWDGPPWLPHILHAGSKGRFAVRKTIRYCPTYLTEARAHETAITSRTTWSRLVAFDWHSATERSIAARFKAAPEGWTSGGLSEGHGKKKVYR
jgi:hypothetical protein